MAGEPKWTPGPWSISDGSPLLVHCGDRWVASAMGIRGDQGAANAVLIAAAPDLYAALEALEPFLDALVCYASTMDEHEPNRLVANARSALSRAQGADR